MLTTDEIKALTNLLFALEDWKEGLIDEYTLREEIEKNALKIRPNSVKEVEEREKDEV